MYLNVAWQVRFWQVSMQMYELTLMSPWGNVRCLTVWRAQPSWEGGRVAEVMAGVVWSVVELWVSLFTYCKIGSGENGLEMGWALNSQRPSSSDLPSPTMLLSQRLYGLPKQCHHLDTKCPSIWAMGGHFRCQTLTHSNQARTFPCSPPPELPRGSS